MIGTALWGESLWGSNELEVVLEVAGSSLVQAERTLAVGADTRIDDPAAPRTGRPFRVSRMFYPGTTASFFLENLRVDGMAYDGPAPGWSLAGASGLASYTRAWDSTTDRITAWQASVPVPETPGEYTLTWSIDTGVVLRQYQETILVVAP